ncbi:MAG: hypothetical protein HQL41_16830 [Alphaproteobacteria bacterium]|nr:hypothetical protein [Alphaproteobacteria bacterium]
MIPDLVFSPLLPWPWIAVPAGLGLALVLWGMIRRARGAWLRLIPLAALALALANPRLAAEQRTPLDDIAVVLIDDSASQEVGDRRALATKAEAQLRERLGRLESLEIRVETVRPAAGRDDGTRLFEALDRALADVPRRRLAGVVLVTDGQIHDVPETLDLGAPLHLLLTGKPGERDRRLVVEQAPSFALVGGEASVRLRVDDPGRDGTARLTLRVDGGDEVVEPVPLNQPHVVSVPIAHGGGTVVELEVEGGPDELSMVNNRAAVTVNGVRDRLRVLLISGEPHAGERTWRNLLKADPSVDLVHFTILRPPEKDDRTPLKELALISFPVRELFEEKLASFDLIILDRYRRRGVLPPGYYFNLTDYVEAGGALLVAVGPEFSDAFSLYDTPLDAVLPAAPAGGVTERPYHPQVSEIGRRHPVTAGLTGAGAVGAQPDWGRWMRQVGARVLRGTPVMEGPGGSPLLVLDRVEKGRVALLLSDSFWLWTRGWEGGGPQAELLRRLAHWLMKEPALEEDMLSAEIRGDRLIVTRRSLDDAPAQAKVTLPDGTERPLTLTEGPDGRAIGEMTVGAPGLYRVGDGARSAVAAAGTVNPVELGELPATDAKAGPLAQANRGGVFWLAEGGVPDARRVAPDRLAVGRDWIGLQANEDHVVTAIRDTPLMPGAALLMLAMGGLILSWWREGR